MAQVVQVALPAAESPPKIAQVREFSFVWFGQLVSSISSGMTGVALGIYVYQRIGSTTDFALIFLAGMLPRALISPLAGVLADRFSRRALMIVADVGAGLNILIALGLALGGRLEVWTIYLATAFGSAFSAIRIPAYVAAAGTLMPTEQHGRVGGMIQLSDAVGQAIAPVAATALISTFRVQSVLLVDLLTFRGSARIAGRRPLPGPCGPSRRARVVPGRLARRLGVPRRPAWVDGPAHSLRHWQLLRRQCAGARDADDAGLRVGADTRHRALDRRGRDAWRWRADERLGRRPATHPYRSGGVWVARIGHSDCRVGPLGGGSRGWLFLAYFSLPFIIGGAQAVLTSKVAPEVQGRVFALRVMLVTLSFTVAFITAGPLADRVFEPLLAVGGPLAESVGQIIGIGAGRGIGLMFVLLGTLAMFTAASGLLNPRLRNVDVELPNAG